MTSYYLMPNDRHKSFYGKAVVLRNDDGSETLFSYKTPVLRREANGDLVRLWLGWSATTGRHIRAFAGLSKAEFLELSREAGPAEKAAAYNGTLYR